MRFSERNGRDGGLDETAAGFIDIQFGLIAVFILLLSAATAKLTGAEDRLSQATTGIGNLSNQLRGVEGGMSGIIDLLLCDWRGDQPVCGSTDHNSFAGHGGSVVLLSRPGQEQVLVLGMTSSGGGDGLFRSAEHTFFTRRGVNREPMTTIRNRINLILPCFAPFSRDTPGLGGETGRANLAWQRCDSSLADRFPDGAPGIDLFQIEGHGDNRPIRDADPLIALHRAQAVLYSLLVEPNGGDDPLALIRRINTLSGAEIARQLDEIAGSNPSVPLGNLFWLAPLGARIMSECRLERQRIEALDPASGETLTVWCERLLGPESDEQTQSPDGQQGSNTPQQQASSSRSVPKLFAMTSYGRYSLRYGTPGEVVDPRDRRVEFRLRGSIIPTSIHDLFTDPDSPYYNNANLFRLYSTAAVMALHACDARREVDATCVQALDRLITPQ